MFTGIGPLAFSLCKSDGVIASFGVSFVQLATALFSVCGSFSEQYFQCMNINLFRRSEF